MVLKACNLSKCSTKQLTHSNYKRLKHFIHLFLLTLIALMGQISASAQKLDWKKIMESIVIFSFKYDTDRFNLQNEYKFTIIALYFVNFFPKNVCGVKIRQIRIVWFFTSSICFNALWHLSCLLEENIFFKKSFF